MLTQILKQDAKAAFNPRLQQEIWQNICRELGLPADKLPLPLEEDNE